MKKLLLLSILLLFLITSAQALPNASLTVNRTGNLGQIPQVVLFTNQTTEPADVTAYNLSVQGTANNTVWRNSTTWTDYEYTYNFGGDFTPYLLVHYSGGTNQSASSAITVRWGLPIASFESNQSGTIGWGTQAVNFNDTSIHNGTSRVWEFKNTTGTQDTDKWTVFGTGLLNQTETFSHWGNYLIRITSTSIEGSNTTTSAYYVNVTPNGTVSFYCTRAGSSSTNLNGTRPFSVSCNGTTDLETPTYHWSSTAETQTYTTENATFTFTGTGYRQITFHVTNATGDNSSSSSTRYIWINKPWWMFW